jgi:uncharacterized protein
LDFSAGAIEDDLAELSSTMEETRWGKSCFIFVCHAPPQHTALDLMHGGLNVGSLAVRRFIERWSGTGRLILSLHGHIHEAPWKSGRVWQFIGHVPCFNVGQTPKMLRALFLNTEEVPASARLVTVGSDGKVTVSGEGMWL